MFHGAKCEQPTCSTAASVYCACNWPISQLGELWRGVAPETGRCCDCLPLNHNGGGCSSSVCGPFHRSVASAVSTQTMESVTRQDIVLRGRTQLTAVWQTCLVKGTDRKLRCGRRDAKHPVAFLGSRCPSLRNARDAETIVRV